MGGPILPRFANQQLSEVRRQGIASSSLPLLMAERENQWWCSFFAAFGLLSAVAFICEGRDHPEPRENWQDAGDPNLFPLL